MTKLVIVEKQELYREGLVCLCGESDLVEVTRSTGSLSDMESWAVDGQVDVFAMSTGFGEVACINAIRQLKKLKTTAQVLVLGADGGESLAARLIRDGAGGYVGANTNRSDFLEAVRNVHSGIVHGRESLREAEQPTLLHDGAAAVHDTLSNREYQVLCLIGSGRTLTQSGQELNLSVKTVSTYRARLLLKLNLKNNAELTRYAIIHKLVD